MTDTPFERGTREFSTEDYLRFAKRWDDAAAIRKVADAHGPKFDAERHARAFRQAASAEEQIADLENWSGAALAELKTHAVNMEYDYPGDVAEECGLWCNICERHCEDDHSGHTDGCLIAIGAGLADS